MQFRRYFIQITESYKVLVLQGLILWIKRTDKFIADAEWT
jgi:hypothetical protein